MLLLSAPLAKSSGSSLGKSIRLEFERPGFESQLDLKVFFHEQGGEVVCPGVCGLDWPVWFGLACLRYTGLV